jgi:hypothetical protein
VKGCAGDAAAAVKIGLKVAKAEEFFYLKGVGCADVSASAGKSPLVSVSHSRSLAFVTV